MPAIETQKKKERKKEIIQVKLDHVPFCLFSVPHVSPHSQKIECKINTPWSIPEIYISNTPFLPIPSNPATV